MTIEDTLRRDLFKSRAKSGDKDRKGAVAADIDLDKHLISSSKQVLLKNVEFVSAQKDISFRLQNLRGKYVPLNPAKAQSQGAHSKKSPSSHNKAKMGSQGDGSPKSDGIPTPKLVLYRADRVQLDWQKCHRVGSGLINMGNTCFLNSTLQCLTYTAPLTNYLLSHQHKEECRSYGFCILCDLCTHIQRAFQHQGQAIRPMNMIHKLKSIAKHMHIGRQEDAHEFLRYVIEAMQKSCLNGYDKLDRYSKETSPVHQIFGGYYRSRVICSACQCKSDTFDPFLDISLDIKHVPSVNKALQRLIQPETLDGDNAYACKRCNRKVPAQKRFTVHRCPNILTLCLKRFEFNRFSMGKINKEVNFSEYLNLRPYMSENKGPPVVFQLYALLKHEGGSCNSGHYYCYVRAPNQSWYCMNDSYVSQTSLNRVLNQNAYVLFYIRKPSKENAHGNNQAQAQQSNKQMPKTATLPGATNKTSNPHQGPLGTPIARPKPTTPKPTTSKPTTSTLQPPFSPKPKIIPEPAKKPQTFTPTAKHSNLPQMIPPPGKRDKLSFVIKNKGVGSMLQSLQKGQSGASENKPVAPEKESLLSPKPGVALGKKSPDTVPKKNKPQSLPKIKEEETTSVSTSKKGTVTPKEGKRSSLVPYGQDDSSSSSDSENYDAVVEQLSKESVKDAGASTSSVGKDSKEVRSDADMKPPESAAEKDKRSALANSTNLTAIRKTDSPLKLTITTNGNAQRIKSTTPWRVTDSDQQVSPSIASDSSNHSNISSNSTSEWSVNDKKDAPSLEETMKKEAQHAGWNVKPSPCRNGAGKLRHDNTEEGRIGTPSKPALFKGHKDVSNGSNSNGKNRTHVAMTSTPKEEKSYLSKREKLGIIPKQLNGKNEQQERTKQSVPESGTDTANVAKENGKSNGKSFLSRQPFGNHKTEGETKNFQDSFKKSISDDSKKKEATSSSSSDESEKGEGDDRKNSESAKANSEKSLKKKKKNKLKQQAESEGKPDNQCNGKKQKTDTVDKGASEDKKLPEGDAFRKYRGHTKNNDSDSDHSDAQFKMKKNNRQPASSQHQPKFPPAPQRFHQRFNSPTDSDYDDDSSPVAPLRPHDQQWRKRGYPEQEYYEERPYSPRQEPHYNQPYGGPPLGNKRKRMMNGYGDNWDKPQHRRFRQEGYSQQWDQHIQEGGYPRRPPINGPHKLSQSWDGSRRAPSGDVIEYFHKAPLKGYGQSVPSWEGGRSEVDEEVARDRSNMKRHNTWDEDFDRGKMKKVRKPFQHHEHYGGHHQHNPFQHAQNQRNKGGFHGNFRGYNKHHMKKSQSWHGSGGRR